MEKLPVLACSAEVDTNPANVAAPSPGIIAATRSPLAASVVSGGSTSASTGRASASLSELEPHVSLRLALSGWSFTDLRVRIPSASSVLALHFLLGREGGVMCAAGEHIRMWRGAEAFPTDSTLIANTEMSTSLKTIGYTDTRKEYTITYDFMPAGVGSALVSELPRSTQARSRTAAKQSFVTTTRSSAAEKPLTRAERRRRESPLRRFAKTQRAQTVWPGGAKEAGRLPTAPRDPPVGAPTPSSLTAAEMRSLEWGPSKRKMYRRRHMTPPKSVCGIKISHRTAATRLTTHVNPVVADVMAESAELSEFGRFYDDIVYSVEAAFPGLDAPARARHVRSEWHEMVAHKRNAEQDKRSGRAVRARAELHAARRRSSVTLSSRRAVAVDPALIKAASLFQMGADRSQMGSKLSKRRQRRKNPDLEAFPTPEKGALWAAEEGVMMKLPSYAMETADATKEADAAEKRASTTMAHMRAGGMLAELRTLKAMVAGIAPSRDMLLRRSARSAKYEKVANDVSMYKSLRSTLRDGQKNTVVVRDASNVDMNAMWKEITALHGGSMITMSFNPLMQWMRAHHPRLSDLEAGMEAFRLTVCQAEGYDLFGKPLVATFGIGVLAQRYAPELEGFDMTRGEEVKGKITKELLPMLMHNINMCNRLAFLYRAADEDGNASIDIAEFGVFCAKLGLTLTPEELFAEFDMIDNNDGTRDGVIFFCNICAWYSRHEWAAEAAFRVRESALVRSCDIFEGMGHKALHAFAQGCMLHEYSDGDDIATAPCPYDYMHFVLAGEVRIELEGRSIMRVEKNGLFCKTHAECDDRACIECLRIGCAAALVLLLGVRVERCDIAAAAPYTPPYAPPYAHPHLLRHHHSAYNDHQLHRPWQRLPLVALRRCPATLRPCYGKNGPRKYATPRRPRAKDWRGVRTSQMPSRVSVFASPPCRFFHRSTPE